MPHPAPPSPNAYVVSRPRASDALGLALRNTFRQSALPADIEALLGKLNAAGSGKRA